MRRIVEIALFTDDPDRLTAFYQRALETEPADRWPGGAIFDLDGLKLLVHVSGPGDRDHVAIGVEDVDDAARRLVEAGVDIEGPADYDWGRSAYFQDPDGRLLEFHRPE